ncbi:hypothetical protein NM208_g4894 [Fusarium decemcellulare]|uniref:Uncharacterized protein n=1 Tax=Fusarium decemcellulare TaxID=57161 RepID=A0ACC1SJD2_9HYPO|nr:hypothetical protein NM208_g4894 [Fusarium decemcellulare]
MGTIAAGVSPQGPVRYADINGDGKADYLVVFNGGAINAYINDNDWAPKLPEKPDQPIPVDPGAGDGDGGNDGDGGDDGNNGGGGSGDGDVVYIDPTIWNSEKPTAGCQPPCTLVLPPWPLSSKTTISFPVITETIKETWPETTDGVTKYRTTTITVRITLPPLTTSEIGVSNVILTESTSKSIPVRGSVIPSPVTLTEPAHDITYTYKPGPLPTGDDDIDIGPPPGIAPGIIVTAGPPGPVCKSGCGTLCLFGCTPGGGGGGGGGGSIGCIGGGCPGPGGNCVGTGCEENNDEDDDDDDEDDDEDEDEEDCATETNTECHQVCTTKPCATVCNTYLGCDCTTSRVTDYWVSCSSSSCTTTSSEVITGCFLTATATTTGASCPLSSLDYENDVLGDDGGDANLGKTYETTLSPTVVVSATPYPVNDGYVTVDRTAYPIPNVKSPTSTKMRGTSAIILPSHVGTTISITRKDITIITASYPKATTTVGEKTTTTKPTSTSETAISYPTNTAINEGEGYCFVDRSGYLEFTIDEAKQVIESFCSASYVLDPNNAFGQNIALEEDGYTVIVSAEWAPDQSGCGTKESFPFAEDDLNFDLCLAGWNMAFFCEDQEADVESSYGGAYVLDPPETGGCILLSLYAYDTSTMRLVARPKGWKPLVPPTVNTTHMGDESQWVPSNKLNVPKVWPASKGSSSKHKELFSPARSSQTASPSTN